MKIGWLWTLALLSALGIVGYRKYREVQAIKDLKISPGTPPFQLESIKSGFVDAFLNLSFINPTDYSFQIRNFQGHLYFKNAPFVSILPVSLTIAAKDSTGVSIKNSIMLKKLLQLAEQIVVYPKAEIVFVGSLTYVSQTLKFSIDLPVHYSFDAKEQLNNFLQENYNVTI